MTNLTSKDFAVLVVDDEVEIAEMIAEEFEELGHTIFVAHSGQAALDIVKGNDVKVVISDVRMPNGDGVTLLKDIIKLEDSKRPLFFFTTGQADIEEKNALDLGALGFFYKPFDLQDLVKRTRFEIEKKYKVNL